MSTFDINSDVTLIWVGDQYTQNIERKFSINNEIKGICVNRIKADLAIIVDQRKQYGDEFMFFLQEQVKPALRRNGKVYLI